jgi:hypothetical protein
LVLTTPISTGELMERVLRIATEETDNPDLRDRAFIYWRLLTVDPAAAQVGISIEISQLMQGERLVVEGFKFKRTSRSSRFRRILKVKGEKVNMSMSESSPRLSGSSGAVRPLVTSKGSPMDRLPRLATRGEGREAPSEEPHFHAFVRPFFSCNLDHPPKLSPLGRWILLSKPFFFIVFAHRKARRSYWSM